MAARGGCRCIHLRALPLFPAFQPRFPAVPPQIRYKEEFEKNKGKGFSVVADTPELQRIKKTQDQISNVSGSLSPSPAVTLP